MIRVYMPKIDQKQQQIIRLMMDGSILSSSKIQQGVIKAGEDVSLPPRSLMAGT